MSAPLLVVRRAALGDFVLTLPVVRALVALGPVHVATHARYAPLLPAGATTHDDAWLWRGDAPPVPYAHAFAFGGVAAEALTGAGLRVSAVAPRPPPGVHALDHYAAVLRDIALPPGAYVRAPHVPVPAGPAVASAGPAPGAPQPVARGHVVIAPGSGGREKRWPLDRWRAVAAELRARGLPVTWVRGPDEADEPGWPPDATCPDLPALLALAAGCRAWIGPDSGPSHVAAAVGANVHVVFGPTDPATWAPVGATVWPWDVDPIALVDGIHRV